MIEKSTIRAIQDELWKPMVTLPGEWVPLLSANEVIVGISTLGELIIDNKGTKYSAGEKNAARALILLEFSPAEVISGILEKLGSNIGNEVIAQLPLVDITKAGFSQGSDYWAKLALDWCAEFKFCHLLSSELGVVQSSKWASQRTRQIARRLLKRIK